MTNRPRLQDSYLAMRDRLARFVMRFLPPQEVEDIVQETYVRICQLEDQTRVRAPERYVLKTARNLALDHLKRAEHRLTSPIDPLTDLEELVASTDATFRTVASNEEFAQFCDAVRQLPRQQRRAFILKKVYGHSQREIADIMGIAEATVESHIVAGTRRCIKHLHEQDAALTKSPHTQGPTGRQSQK